MRVMNTFLLPGMENPSCPQAKGSKLQPCLTTGTDVLQTFSNSSTHLSCKRKPAAHSRAFPIFRDEVDSKSQQNKTFQKVARDSQSLVGEGQALDKAASQDMLRYVSPCTSRDIFYCPQLREHYLQNKEQMVQTHNSWGLVPPWCHGYLALISLEAETFRSETNFCITKNH